MVAIGDTLPDATFLSLDGDNVLRLSTADVFAGRAVLAIGVVGAFTPVCDKKHLPDFVPYQRELAKAGLIDHVVCIAVDADPFVMRAWADSLDITDGIQMLTDRDAAFAQAMDLTIDLDEAFGIGVRSQRYVFVARDAKIEILNVEASPADVDVTSAAAMRKVLVG